MYVREKTKEEIEKKVFGMSDMVKIEYLESAAKILGGSVDVRRFVHEKLAELYEKKGMFKEAARNIVAASLVCVTFREISKLKLKEAELHIKAGEYEAADSAFNQAVSNAGKQEKDSIKKLRKEIYSKQAEDYEKKTRCSHALRIYERIYSEERSLGLKEKLRKLYERLGKIRELRSLN